MEKVKKIDVHLHATMWNREELYPTARIQTADEVRANFERSGTERGFVLSLISPDSNDKMQSNEEMAYLANTNPDILNWFCNVDPRMLTNSSESNFSDMLMFYKSRGAIGFGEVTANLYTDDPRMDNLFYHAAACDLPVTIHIAPNLGRRYGIADELGLPRLEKMLKKHENLKIIGHSPCFWSEIGDDVTERNRNGYVRGKVNPGRVVSLMRECPNLYCDISADSGYTAISRDPEFSYRFIEEFSDRIMYASDTLFPNYMPPQVAWLDEACERGDISYENYRKICRDNAIRIFKLNI